MPGSSAAPSRNQRFLRKQVIQSLGLRKEVGVLLSGGKAQDRPQVVETVLAEEEPYDP